MKLHAAVVYLSMIGNTSILAQSDGSVPISSIADEINIVPDKACKNLEVDFLVQEGNPEMQAVEDDIRANLAKVGIKVNILSLNDTK